MSDNNINKLVINLNSDFKFLDVSIPYLYSLSRTYGSIEGEAVIRAKEFDRHLYFNPFFCVRLTKTKFDLSLRVKNGFLSLSYDGSNPPQKEILELVEILLKVYYYKELDPSNKEVFDKIYSLFNEKNITLLDGAQTPIQAKKNVEKLVKLVRNCKIEEIIFNESGQIQLVPYKKYSPEELKELGELEGKISYNYSPTIYTHHIVLDSKKGAKIETPEECE